MYPKYETMTRAEWLKTIAHDHQNPARNGAYVAIADHLDTHKPWPKVLAELGFCSCYDFATQFKEWHDGGTIEYVGYDTCPQFADYAKAEFPGYDFRFGSAETMESCDISYAKHVFMTMQPELMPPVLANLLAATRELSVINWHYAPKMDDHYYLRHQEGERDVWTNRYDKNDIMVIYDAYGFAVEEQSFGQDMLYVARRGDA